MAQIDLEVLGITKEQLMERVVAKVSADLLIAEATDSDEDGRPYSSGEDSAFATMMQEHIRERIDAAVSAIAERTVLPQVGELIENFSIQKTNEWGEKKGEPVTFVEYLTQRADAYLREMVDSNGKTKAQSSSSYFTGKTTRIAYMIDEHLHYNIDKAMQAALKDANSSIAGGILEAVKMKLAEIQASMKVSVTTR